MARYLYVLRSNLCKCSHANVKHTPKCSDGDCKCDSLELQRFDVEADTILEAAEKLNLKLDDIVYTYKTKL